MPPTSTTALWIRSLATICLLALSLLLRAQTSPTPQRLSDLFSIEVKTSNGDPYLILQPDSTTAKERYGPVGGALWHIHDHLFNHHAKVVRHQGDLLARLPDTTALNHGFRQLLDTDTAFEHLYLASLQRAMVAPLTLDSALLIAAHYYCLHRGRNDTKVNLHVCIGINKVMELNASPAHAYHAAFCYLAIRDQHDEMRLGMKAVEPYRKELRNAPSDARVLELEQVVYESVSKDPELKRTILDAYARTSKFLNFELLY